jgi:Tol biopolymer transport system component/tRNA A-37 threonylcarbamoyl transferase component Bud32
MIWRNSTCAAGVADHEPLIAGRYRLTQMIGAGGMGVVWRARDEILGRDVAVKEVVFPVRLPEAERRLACARSLREARAAARLSHPAVITVHDVIEHDDRPWIVMELFRSGSLAGLIEAGPLPVPQVARIGLDVLEALSAAHSAGVIHRDVKPSNILVDGTRAVLTDFGAAAIMDDPALTQSGLVIGTPAYLAPERARHGQTGPESDLWSLGATLYAAVEGRPPYTGEDSLAVLSALLTRDPEPHVRAGSLAPVLDGLLRPDPAQRITAAQAAAMLAAIASQPPDSPAASVHPPTVPAALPGGQEQAAPATLTSAGLAPATPAAQAPAPGAPRRRPRRRAPLIAVGATAAVALAVAAVLLAVPGKNAAAGAHRSAAAASSRAARSTATPRVHHTATPPAAPALTLRGASGAVAFSRDGRTLAVGADNPNSTVYLWNPATGRRTAVLTDPDGTNIKDLAFDPRGSILAVVDDLGSTCLFDPVTGKLIATFTIGGGPNNDSYNQVAFSPDGDAVADIYYNSIYVWDIATGRPAVIFREPNKAGFDAVAFSPDGKTLAAGRFGGSIYLWNTATHALITTVRAPSTQRVDSLAFSPDGKTLAGADVNGRTYLWNTASWALTATLIDPAAVEVDDVAFSADGKTLAAADSNGSTYLWNTAGWTLTATLTDPAEDGVAGVAFSPDGKTLATADINGSTYLWNMSWLDT